MAVVLNRSAVSIISLFFPQSEDKAGLFKLSLRHLRTAQLLLIRFSDSKQRKEDMRKMRFL